MNNVKIDAAKLRSLAAELLVAAGAGREPALEAADLFVEADLNGVGVQGVDYLYYVIDSLQRGIIDGEAMPTMVQESASTASIDGHRGLGQPAALLAVEVAGKKAKESGSATVCVTNSTDIFMIGAYAERLARQGCVGIVMTSGPPLVHPYGGVERLMSTNPIAFGFPRPGNVPFVFDMATSALASSRVRQAAYRDESVPPGSGIGPDGLPTTSARAIRKGAIGPLAGHKGFGLALCIGLMCGPMTGSGVGPELAGWQATGETRSQGHFFYAADPGRFVAYNSFLERVEWYLQLIKHSATAPGFEKIRIPGEHRAQVREAQEAHGVEILPETWSKISEYAERLKVELPVV